MYHTDTVLSLILLVFEILDIPKTKVKDYFLKKLDFITNKCFAQGVFRKYPTKKISAALQLSQYIVMCTNFLIIYPCKRAITVNKIHCPYKQSLS